MNVPTTHAEARQRADAARDRANRIRQFFRRELLLAIENQTPNGKRYAAQNFEVLLDRTTAADSSWKAAVAENQWMIQYATMYAQTELLELLNRVVKHLDTPSASR